MNANFKYNMRRSASKKVLKIQGKYECLEMSKEEIVEFLRKANYDQDIIYSFLKGYKSEKFEFEGLDKCECPLLLRLRYGAPSGIDIWKLGFKNPKYDWTGRPIEHRDSILEEGYNKRALTEWVYIPNLPRVEVYEMKSIEG